jgi:hypothetical protein
LPQGASSLTTDRPVQKWQTDGGTSADTAAARHITQSLFFCRTSWRGKTYACRYRPQPFRQRHLDPPGGLCRHQDCSLPASRVPSQGRTLATHLASALHDLCGKPIPAPLKSHSVGRGTSVPTENTGACRRTDSLVRLGGHCCIGANRHGHTLGKCAVHPVRNTDSGPDVAHVQ